MTVELARQKAQCELIDQDIKIIAEYLLGERKIKASREIAYGVQDLNIKLSLSTSTIVRNKGQSKFSNKQEK